MGRKKTHVEYVKEVELINPNIEVIGTYVGAHVKIKHYCKSHNIYWDAQPTNILNGQGCKNCAKEKLSKFKTKTHEEYTKDVSVISPHIIVKEQYINARTPILHKCLIDNYEWRALPYSILRGHGCPKCNESKGERQIRQWLENNHIKYEFQYIFDDCCDKKPLPFDFYLPKFNQCIEYDGGQHYFPVDFSGEGIKHAEEQFQKIQHHDNIKNEYCKNNGISLLRIPYFKNIEEELNNFLFI